MRRNVQLEGDMGNEALKLAKNCRHYAMCKIDFLGTGVCASGRAERFVSYYPQGRMALYAALAQGDLPITDKAVEIANGCDLCGRCDLQCYFYTGMRPMQVMRALKELVALQVPASPPPPAEEDPLLREMRDIVGARWAQSDPALTVAYAQDPCPLAVAKLPRYVVMPDSRAEVAALVRLFLAHKLNWTVRGNGTNILGFVLSDGVVIDLNRMDQISFDEKNYLARIGPGVTAFDLQREAVKLGYRVNVAEPAAVVTGSTMCSGILSLFAASYGSCADNLVDAEFVAPDGASFSLNQKNGPNLFAFHPSDQPIPGICTSASVKIHRTTSDEGGVLVPFETLDQAVAFAGECALRRIGFGIGLLGAEYVSSFMSPTQELADTLKTVLTKKLGMAYLVLVLGDRYALNSVVQMGHPLLDQRLFRALNLALPALGSAQWLDLLASSSHGEPFSYLQLDNFVELAETALAPSAVQISQSVDPELRPFFTELYSRPELTDLVWLNMFRITSSRIGREKHFFPIIVYLPLDASLIAELCGELELIAVRHSLKHAFGFTTPVDGGKRCILEYDYFIDHTDDVERSLLRLAAEEVGAALEEYSANTGTVRWLRYLLYQGYCRKENFLYC